MANFLLDTSVIIDFLNKRKNRRELLKQLHEAGHYLSCCAVNVAEIYAGLLPQEEARALEFLESLEYYEIDFDVAALSGKTRQEFRKKGITLATTDTIIAAVAVYYDLTLITDNVKDFPMKEIKLYKGG